MTRFGVPALSVGFLVGSLPRLGVLSPRTLSQLRGLRRSRRQLLDLDAHRLSDIGVTREEAVLEASRGFWDVSNQVLR